MLEKVLSDLIHNMFVYDYASIAGLMGRNTNRGHWPEFQIRPDMSSGEVLMVYYMYSK